MREAIVTVGTRGAGKSSFCEKAIAFDPSIVKVSRDEILLEMFGSTYRDPYVGNHGPAYDKMWRAVKKHLKASESKMILDLWNGDSNDRHHIIRKLREFGADRVVAWYFITPVELVEEWFWRKPGIAKSGEMRNHQGKELVFYSKDAPRRDHELFHQLAANIYSDDFDGVIRINPITTELKDIICCQTSFKW